MTRFINGAGEVGARRFEIFKQFIEQGLVHGQFGGVLDEVEVQDLLDRQDYGPGSGRS